MADWSYTPLVEGFELTTEPPPTLISTFEDGAFVSREKIATYRRRWRERYVMTAAEADSATDFYRTKGSHTAFTKFTWDPKDAASTTANARFSGPFRVLYRGVECDTEAEFVEDLG